jgi:chaperone required for assembly of F1-ATPase
MRDILHPEFPLSDPNPMKRAQNAMARQALPKRFYRDVTVAESGGLHAILLDGRPARTPGRNPLALDSPAAAELLAAEWRAQADVVDPAVMHATRIANTGLDAVSKRLPEVQADVASYAGSDLVCYRAGEPEGLVARQNELWNPVVAWAREALGAGMMLAEGVMHVAQAPEALAAVEAVVRAERHPVRLAALHVLTTMSGSCLIALKFRSGVLDVAEAWRAATVDEDWNASLWGRDEEAEARMARRRAEFGAAAALLAALPADPPGG